VFVFTICIFFGVHDVTHIFTVMVGLTIKLFTTWVDAVPGLNFGVPEMGA